MDSKSTLHQRPAWRRLEKKHNSYSPDKDVELIRIGVEPEARSRHIAMATAKEGEGNRCAACFNSMYVGFFENSLTKQVQKLDVLTGYKPFSLLRHYFKGHTTGLSSLFTIMLLIFTSAYSHYSYKRYYATESRTAKNRPFLTAAEVSLELPALAGIGYFNPGYTGSATHNVSFEACSYFINDNLGINATCTTVSSVACNTLSNTGLSDAELTMLGTLGLKCPASAQYLSATRDTSKFTKLVASISFIGNTGDIATMLQTDSGGNFFAIAGLYVADETKERKSLSLSAGYSLKKFAGTSTSLVRTSFFYQRLNLFRIFRGQYPFTATDDFAVRTGEGEGTVAEPIASTLATTAGTKVFEATYILAEDEYLVEVSDRLFLDIFVNVCGFLLFMYIVAAPIRYYNRWQYRNSATCCKFFKNPFGGELFGNPVSLNNVSENRYMENFLIRMFEEDIVGSDMLEKVQEEAQANDSYDMARRVFKGVKELKQKLTDTFELKDSL